MNFTLMEDLDVKELPPPVHINVKIENTVYFLSLIFPNDNCPFVPITKKTRSYYKISNNVVPQGLEEMNPEL